MKVSPHEEVPAATTPSQAAPLAEDPQTEPALVANASFATHMGTATVVTTCSMSAGSSADTAATVAAVGSSSSAAADAVMRPAAADDSTADDEQENADERTVTLSEVSMSQTLSSPHGCKGLM